MLLERSLRSHEQLRAGFESRPGHPERGGTHQCARELRLLAARWAVLARDAACAGGVPRASQALVQLLVAPEEQFLAEAAVGEVQLRQPPGPEPQLGVRAGHGQARRPFGYDEERLTLQAKCRLDGCD